MASYANPTQRSEQFKDLNKKNPVKGAALKGTEKVKSGDGKKLARKTGAGSAPAQYLVFPRLVNPADDETNGTVYLPPWALEYVWTKPEMCQIRRQAWDKRNTYAVGPAGITVATAKAYLMKRLEDTRNSMDLRGWDEEDAQEFKDLMIPSADVIFEGSEDWLDGASTNAGDTSDHVSNSTDEDDDMSNYPPFDRGDRTGGEGETHRESILWRNKDGDVMRTAPITTSNGRKVHYQTAADFDEFIEQTILRKVTDEDLKIQEALWAEYEKLQSERVKLRGIQTQRWKMKKRYDAFSLLAEHRDQEKERLAKEKYEESLKAEEAQKLVVKELKRTTPADLTVQLAFNPKTRKGFKVELFSHCGSYTPPPTGALRSVWIDGRNQGHMRDTNLRMSDYGIGARSSWGKTWWRNLRTPTAGAPWGNYFLPLNADSTENQVYRKIENRENGLAGELPYFWFALRYVDPQEGLAFNRKLSAQRDVVTTRIGTPFKSLIYKYSINQQVANEAMRVSLYNTEDDVPDGVRNKLQREKDKTEELVKEISKNANEVKEMRPVIQKLYKWVTKRNEGRVLADARNKPSEFTKDVLDSAILESMKKAYEKLARVRSQYLPTAIPPPMTRPSKEYLQQQLLNDDDDDYDNLPQSGPSTLLNEVAEVTGLQQTSTHGEWQAIFDSIDEDEMPESSRGDKDVMDRAAALEAMGQGAHNLQQRSDGGNILRYDLALYVAKLAGIEVPEGVPGPAVVEMIRGEVPPFQYSDAQRMQANDFIYYLKSGSYATALPPGRSGPCNMLVTAWKTPRPSQLRTVFTVRAPVADQNRPANAWKVGLTRITFAVALASPQHRVRDGGPDIRPSSASSRASSTVAKVFVEGIDFEKNKVNLHGVNLTISNLREVGADGWNHVSWTFNTTGYQEVVFQAEDLNDCDIRFGTVEVAFPFNAEAISLNPEAWENFQVRSIQCVDTRAQILQLQHDFGINSEYDQVYETFLAEQDVILESLNDVDAFVKNSAAEEQARVMMEQRENKVAYSILSLVPEWGVRTAQRHLVDYVSRQQIGRIAATDLLATIEEVGQTGLPLDFETNLSFWRTPGSGIANRKADELLIQEKQAMDALTFSGVESLYSHLATILEHQKTVQSRLANEEQQSADAAEVAMQETVRATAARSVALGSSSHQTQRGQIGSYMPSTRLDMDTRVDELQNLYDILQDAGAVLMEDGGINFGPLSEPPSESPSEPTARPIQFDTIAPRNTTVLFLYKTYGPGGHHDILRLERQPTIDKLRLLYHTLHSTNVRQRMNVKKRSIDLIHLDTLKQSVTTCLERLYADKPATKKLNVSATLRRWLNETSSFVSTEDNVVFHPERWGRVPEEGD